MPAGGHISVVSRAREGSAELGASPAPASLAHGLLAPGGSDMEKNLENGYMYQHKRFSTTDQ